MSIIKMRGPIDVLFAFKIFSLPVPTRPGTGTFWQVPDPSRPKVKNPYPSDPVYHLSDPFIQYLVNSEVASVVKRMYSTGFTGYGDACRFYGTFLNFVFLYLYFYFHICVGHRAVSCKEVMTREGRM